jgi:hypothetical protein
MRSRRYIGLIRATHSLQQTTGTFACAHDFGARLFCGAVHKPRANGIHMFNRAEIDFSYIGGQIPQAVVDIADQSYGKAAR